MIVLLEVVCVMRANVRASVAMHAKRWALKLLWCERGDGYRKSPLNFNE